MAWYLRLDCGHRLPATDDEARQVRRLGRAPCLVCGELRSLTDGGIRVIRSGAQVRMERERARPRVTLHPKRRASRPDAERIADEIMGVAERDRHTPTGEWGDAVEA